MKMPFLALKCAKTILIVNKNDKTITKSMPRRACGQFDRG
jgi:hypothetical protein